MMSPGLVAVPEGMFSVAGTTATISAARPSSAIAATASRTAAAPDMSIFISCIEAEGFREMPPLSKVTPLPTSPRVWPPPPARSRRTIRRGSSSLPLLTASRPPILRAEISARPRISASTVS